MIHRRQQKIEARQYGKGKIEPSMYTLRFAKWRPWVNGQRFRIKIRFDFDSKTNYQKHVKKFAIRSRFMRRRRGNINTRRRNRRIDSK